MSTKQSSENGNELGAMRKDSKFSVGIISKQFSICIDTILFYYFVEKGEKKIMEQYISFVQNVCSISKLKIKV